MILYYIVWQARRLPRMYNHSACIQLSSPGLFIVTWFWDHHKYELGDRALSKLGPALLQIKIRTICLSAMQVKLILNSERMLDIFLYLLWYFVTTFRRCKSSPCREEIGQNIQLYLFFLKTVDFLNQKLLLLILKKLILFQQLVCKMNTWV